MKTSKTVLLVVLALLAVPSLHAQTMVRGSRVIEGTLNYCADAGASDTYACNLSPAITAYTTGTTYVFKANTANTGIATINLNSLGAKTIKKAEGGVTTDLENNDIRAGQPVLVFYDGTNMQMLNTVGNELAATSDLLIPGADDTIPVSNGTSFESKALCDGGIINYTTATNTFACTLTSAQFLTALSDTLDLGGEASFELPNAAAPTTDAAGEIALDTTIIDHQPLLQYFDGGENMTVIAIDTAQLPALDDEIIKYDAAADKFVLEADAGGAGTKTYAVWTSLSNQPPATSFATQDTRNSIPVLDFEDGTDTTSECAIFGGILPEGYNAETLQTIIHWTATTATTGDNKWNVQWERMNTDLDADSFATAQTTTSTTNGTSGIVTATTITFTSAQIDGTVANEPFRLKVCRDADAAGDTMTGDAELHRVHLRKE